MQREVAVLESRAIKELFDNRVVCVVVVAHLVNDLQGVILFSVHTRRHISP